MCRYRAFQGTLLLSLWGSTWMARCSFYACVHGQLCPTLCNPTMLLCPWNFPVRILEKWVAIYSSRGSSWTRDQTNVSCISCFGGRFFTTEPPGKLLPQCDLLLKTISYLQPFAQTLTFFQMILFVFVLFCFFQKEFLQLSLMLLILIPSLHSQEGNQQQNKAPKNQHWWVGEDLWVLQ